MMSNPSGQPQAIPLVTPASDIYGGEIDTFMMIEGTIANDASLIVPLNRGNEKDGLTNARVGVFKDKPLNMGVFGLQGCTSAVVISEKGAWVSHIWESPAMKDRDLLEKDALSVIRNGDATIDPKTGQEWVPKLSSMVGPGQMFHQEFKPRIFLLTPWSSKVAEIGLRRYEWQVKKIESQLLDVIPAASSTIAEYDVCRLVKENEFTAKGKLLVQYTPAQKILPGLPQQAVARIYVPDNLNDVMEVAWDAHQDQKL